MLSIWPGEVKSVWPWSECKRRDLGAEFSPPVSIGCGQPTRKTFELFDFTSDELELKQENGAARFTQIRM